MTRTAGTLLTAAVALAGCSSPTTSGGLNTTHTFTATLLPASVVPRVTGGEETGRGAVTITLRVTANNSGVVTSATADFRATVNDFPFDSLFQAAHVHRGNAACQSPCPVVIDTTAITAPGVLFATRAGVIEKNGVALNPPGLATEMLNTPGDFYFDIHTAANQNGAARGQHIKTP
jgi:hypothetical protein